MIFFFFSSQWSDRFVDDTNDYRTPLLYFATNVCRSGKNVSESSPPPPPLSNLFFRVGAVLSEAFCHP